MPCKITTEIIHLIESVAKQSDFKKYQKIVAMLLSPEFSSQHKIICKYVNEQKYDSRSDILYLRSLIHIKGICKEQDYKKGIELSQNGISLNNGNQEIKTNHIVTLNNIAFM